MTRVLPNQRRSGWMRVLGSSLDWNSCGCRGCRGGISTTPTVELASLSWHTSINLTWCRILPFLSLVAVLLYILRRRTCTQHSPCLSGKAVIDMHSTALSSRSTHRGGIPLALAALAGTLSIPGVLGRPLVI